MSINTRAWRELAQSFKEHHQDLIDHDLDGDCVCLPDVETVESDTGEIVFLTQHRSIDGREAQEVEADGMGA